MKAKSHTTYNIPHTTYAHVDADSFFASVLVRKDPRLKGKPLLALGMGGGGFVIAATYEAKAKGVKTGMRVTDALKLCPEALQIPSDFRETGIASHQIEEILAGVCPQIEQMSVDEWYLDLNACVGGEPPDLFGWAKEVQQTILKRTALSVSIGVGPSKLLAKMAGEYRKPGGITILDEKVRNLKSEIRNKSEARMMKTSDFKLQISDFLKDRSAAAIPGIGSARQIHTEAHGWKTAWDIATAPADLLQKLFGRPGLDLQRELLGESVSPVTTEHAPPQSISRARSFSATPDCSFLWAHLLRHLEYTVMKMRRQGLATRGITVWMRDHEYHHQSLHKRLPQPMDTEHQIQPYIEECFEKMWRHCVGAYGHTPLRDMPLQKCTQTGLALWDLRPQGSLQYSLFQEPEKINRDAEVQRALDSLHERYGRNAVTRAAALAVKSGTSPQMDFTVYE